MIFTKYNFEIKDDIIRADIKRIINQVYKLLPMREEKSEWEKPLETIMIELSGMQRLFEGQQEVFFSLLCKLEGLFTLIRDEDFQAYRRTIFECLGLLDSLCKDVA